MATRFNGKTYEEAHKKSLKSLESDSSIPRHSQEIPSQKSDTREDYSLIPKEVARLINPVIESTINTAVEKLLLEIGKISQQLGCHDKKFSELESVVSSDDSNKMQKKTDQLENKMQDLLLKVDNLENRARRNNLRFVGIKQTH
ncbi:hypothetical protein XELAEV_18030555mg [Xenopus laevis]|uniref:Uncharacterized protein n=1 Tax=Xenopus laevis TaxID=8355 RepID=A0A974HF66_XENLA|nr:hypothetical protein XELAEV_18030555mg [Xenopus laevis]